MAKYLLFLNSLVLVGCSGSPPVPILPPVIKITAKLHDVPLLGVEGIKKDISVPNEELEKFFVLINPVERCVQQIHPVDHYLLADILLEHPNNRYTQLIVRWTGHNPAAVSLDGKNYFYGGMDDFPDGGTNVARLLTRYHRIYPKAKPD